MRFTPNGKGVIFRHLWISRRRASGVGCVRAVSFACVGAKVSEDCLFFSFWARYSQKEGVESECYCTYYSKTSGVAHSAG